MFLYILIFTKHCPFLILPFTPALDLLIEKKDIILANLLPFIYLFILGAFVVIIAMLLLAMHSGINSGSTQGYRMLVIKPMQEKCSTYWTTAPTPHISIWWAKKSYNFLICCNQIQKIMINFNLLPIKFSIISYKCEIYFLEWWVKDFCAPHFNPLEC